MPSRRVEWLINSMTEREYREAKEAYESFHPEAGSMNFEEYTEEPAFEKEFEEELEAACGGARNFGGFGRSHYVGSRMPYDGSQMPVSREDRGRYASGSSHGHGHGDLQRSGRGGAYDTHSDYESFARVSGGSRAGGEGGGPDPSLTSEETNYYGPGFIATGGNRPCCGAPQPPSRRAVFSSTRLGSISSFPNIGSRSHGDQEGSRSQGR